MTGSSILVLARSWHQARSQSVEEATTAGMRMEMAWPLQLLITPTALETCKSWMIKLWFLGQYGTDVIIAIMVCRMIWTQLLTLLDFLQIFLFYHCVQIFHCYFQILKNWCPKRKKEGKVTYGPILDPSFPNRTWWLSWRMLRDLWSQSHLLCPNDPCGYTIGEGDA